MKYTTSLRPWVSRRLEEIGKVDLLVGIPCYNNQSTIAHVIKMVSEGLHRHYPQMRSLIMVSDGGSTDDTRDVAQAVVVNPYIEKIVQIYRGYPGKATALRVIFEAATFLDAKACEVVDSDLRSITPDWVRFLLHPILEGQFHFVAPLYNRYKRIRYYGFLANRYRREKLGRCRELLSMPSPEKTAPVPEPQKDYRDRYQELTGLSLDQCPLCLEGRMIFAERLAPAGRVPATGDTS